MNNIDSEADEFVKRAAELLPRLLRLLLHREHSDLTGQVLTFPQYNTLLCLYDAGPLSMHAIASQINTTPSNLTGIMDRLVNMDMVLRFNSDDDRRLVMAKITEKGSLTLEKVINRKHKTLHAIYALLDPADRDVFIQVLRRTLEALDLVSDVEVTEEGSHARD